MKQIEVRREMEDEGDRMNLINVGFLSLEGFLLPLHAASGA